MLRNITLKFWRLAQQQIDRIIKPVHYYTLEAFFFIENSFMSGKAAQTTSLWRSALLLILTCQREKTNAVTIVFYTVVLFATQNRTNTKVTSPNQARFRIEALKPRESFLTFRCSLAGKLLARHNQSTKNSDKNRTTLKVQWMTQ